MRRTQPIHQTEPAAERRAPRDGRARRGDHEDGRRGSRVNPRGREPGSAVPKRVNCTNSSVARVQRPRSGRGPGGGVRATGTSPAGGSPRGRGRGAGGSSERSSSGRTEGTPEVGGAPVGAAGRGTERSPGAAVNVDNSTTHERCTTLPRYQPLGPKPARAAREGPAKDAGSRGPSREPGAGAVPRNRESEPGTRREGGGPRVRATTDPTEPPAKSSRR